MQMCLVPPTPHIHILTLLRLHTLPKLYNSMKTREEMIDELVEHELEVNYTDPSYIRAVLREGLTGYDALTDSEVEALWKAIQ